jgi:hypothetical protein
MFDPLVGGAVNRAPIDPEVELKKLLQFQAFGGCHAMLIAQVGRRLSSRR